ncbi:MAG: 4Fe-4S binding protein [Treponema sp.]|jgi:ferredoxin|nr:4Fe-4S binding protein [Treponema sp.]
MIQKIIKINSEKCDACGACVSACHEGAIVIKNGKATLNQVNLCDGLGNCLPVCPTGAISFEEIMVPEPAKQLDSTRPNQWPLQIKLTPIHSTYFENANLLIAADCTAFRYSKFHEDFMKDTILLIGCPKLDNIDYSEKLAQIIAENSIKSLRAARMEVPCCGGIEWALSEALKKSGKSLALQIITLSIDGRVLEVR